MSGNRYFVRVRDRAEDKNCIMNSVATRVLIDEVGRAFVFLGDSRIRSGLNRSLEEILSLQSQGVFKEVDFLEFSTYSYKTDFKRAVSVDLKGDTPANFEDAW